MLDRINMTCPKCGSEKGVVCLVTDPSSGLDWRLKAWSAYLPIRATCLGCWYEAGRWVHIGQLRQLLSSYHRSNGIGSSVDRVFKREGVRPKSWRLQNDIPLSIAQIRRQRSRVFKLLLLIAPDVYGWFNGKELGGWSELRRDLMSRRRHFDVLREVASSQEFHSLWASVIRSTIACILKI